MIAFAIQLSDGTYIKYETSGPVFPSYYRKVSITDDVNDAKHYKKEGFAKAVLTRAISDKTTHIENLKEQLEGYKLQNVASSQFSWLERQITKKEELLDQVRNMCIVEVDVDKPNFSGKGMTCEIKFEDYGIGFTTKKSQGNCHCKGCGIYFKGIPLLQFGTRSAPDRICPLCIQERAHEAQRLLDDMPEHVRETYEVERFVHRMG